MSDNPLHDAIEDAMWQALEREQSMPHSGVDPAYVIPEFIRLLAKAGYAITRTARKTTIQEAIASSQGPDGQLAD